MFRNFISHNRTHKNPLQTHNFFTLGSHKKTIAKFYGDVTLVMSESLWWNPFHKEVKSWDSTTCFRIRQFQTPGLKAVSSNASPGWTVRFFEVGDHGSSGSASLDLIRGLFIRRLFFCLISQLYSMQRSADMSARYCSWTVIFHYCVFCLLFSITIIDLNSMHQLPAMSSTSAILQ
jgi:hypothetical protein